MIASDIPGCLELVEHGVNGIVVPVNDATALADAIECLVHDPEERKRLGTAGRRCVEKYFSEETITGQTMSLYEDLSRHVSLKSVCS